MFKKLLTSFLLLLLTNISFGKDSSPPKFIVENNLANTYNLGSQFVDHVSTLIYDAKNPNWFAGFVANVDVNVFEGSFPSDYVGDIGYFKIIQEFNNFIKTAEEVNYKKSLKNKGDVARAGVGLILLLDRAKYRHINKTLELKTLSEYIYKKFLMHYIGGIGILPDSAPFFMSFFIARHFDFPMDLVSQGMNSLGQLSLAYLKKNDKVKQRAIFQFMSGYAKYGLEKNNKNFQLFNSFDHLKWQIPIQLVNTILEFVKEGDIENRDIRLFALQEKYRLAVKYQLSDETEKVNSELLNIYIKHKAKKWELIKLKISNFISDDVFRIGGLLFGLLLMLIRPSLLTIKKKGKFILRLKVFFQSVWEAILGQHSSFWGQLGLFIVVFSISMYFSDIKDYSPPLDSFIITN